jgi:hypothetical protein
MDNLFTKTPSSYFAAIAIAGVVASGYMSFEAGKPIVTALVGGQVAGISNAVPVQQKSEAAATTTKPEVKSVAAIKSQADSVANKVEQMQEANQTKNDQVLGAGDESTTVPVREEFPPAVNLLRNSSFEEDNNGAPRQWNYQYDSNSGNTMTTLEAIRTGAKGLKVVGGGTGNFGLSQPAAKEIERRDYAFSVWVKPVNTDAHTVKLSFWDEVNNKEAKSKTFSFSGTKEWSRLVFQISNKNTWNGKKWFPMITVNGLAKGALYIEDAQLEEASSFTPYHFVGGGATQSHVSILGDGSVEIDAHGNIYPAVDGVGGLGTGSNRFSELRLTKATIDNNGSLTLDGDITVNGNGTFKGAVAFSGTIKSHLIPDQDSTYDLGSTAKKWRIGYINQVYLQNAETIGNNVDGDITFIESNTGGNNTLVFDMNAATDAIELRNDTEDLRLRAAGNGNLVMRAGDGATDSTVNGNDLFLAAEDAMTLRSATYNLTTSGSTITMVALNSGITMSTGSDTQGTISLKSAGSLKLDTSVNNTNLLIDSGTGDLIANVGTHTEVAQDNTINAISLSASRGGINLSSSSASGSGDIKLRSAGTLHLDTSANNTNILANTGTGRLIATSNNAGNTAIQLLATNGGIDISTSGFGGLGELRLRAGGSLKLDTSGNNNNILIDSGTGDLLANIGTGTISAIDDTTVALALRAARGGIELSTSNANGNGNLTLKSGGTLQLDTSVTNSGVNIFTGTGALTTNTGTIASTATTDAINAISLSSSRGGIQLSSSNANGNGDVRILSAGTLQLDTSATNSNILARTGTGSFNVTNTSRSTQAIALLAGNGGIDISTGNADGNGALVLRSGGSLKLDTSGNNNNILIDSGTGDLLANIGTGTVTAQDDVIAALGLRASRGGILLSTSNASGNGDMRLLSAGTMQLDTSVTGSSVLVRTGAGQFSVNAGQGASNAISLLATNGGIDLSTSGANGNGNLTLRSAGTLRLDASASDTNIEIVAGGDASRSLILQSDRGGIDISTSSASGAGNLTLRSAGTLQLDTSSTSANIIANTGAGRFVVTAGGTGTGANSAIRLAATNGGIDLSTSGGNGNGNMIFRSAGTLQLDTSANNSNILVRAGTGRIDLSANTILINSGAGTLDLSANNTISIVSSTTARVWGETGTLVGRAGTSTRVHGRLCIEGSGDGSTCPAGNDGRLFVNTTGEAVDDSGDVFDLAEYYPSSEPVDPGTVVIADSGSRATVKKSQYAYQRVLGVVSTTPAIRINEGSFEVGGSAIKGSSVKPLIALVGRVPVKVSSENGSIKVGDRLVASAKAGYAMKATKQGMTLGMALEDMNFENGVTDAKVMTFVNVSWYFPEVVEELEREYQTAQVLGTQPSATAALTAATSSVPAEGSDPSSNVDGSVPSASSTGIVAGAATVAAPTVTVATPPTEFPNLIVTKALTVGKELKVSGKATFEGEVEVVADATFGKNVIIVGNLRIGGNLEVAGAIVTSMTAGASIAAGDPVAVGSDGKVYRAGSGKAVIGVATLNVAAGEAVKIAVAGKVGNMTGLTTGARYFVNETGSLTTDGQGGQGLGVAVSATEMLVQPGIGLPASQGEPAAAKPVTETAPAIGESSSPNIPQVPLNSSNPVESSPVPVVVPAGQSPLGAADLAPTETPVVVPTVIPTLTPTISTSL